MSIYGKVISNKEYHEEIHRWPFTVNGQRLVASCNMYFSSKSLGNFSWSCSMPRTI
ncbi:MAG: hypothetical protein WCJ03_13130 [Bacteroidales bacterium]